MKNASKSTTEGLDLDLEPIAKGVEEQEGGGGGEGEGKDVDVNAVKFATSTLETEIKSLS